MNGVVREMADARESAKPAELTIPMAIDYAAWLERTPDAITTPEKLKEAVRVLHAALQRSSCYHKAMKNGEEVFVLRSIDRAAPSAIVAWADTAAEHGCRAEKIDDAYRMSGRWISQPKETTKWPD